MSPSGPTQVSAEVINAVARGGRSRRVRGIYVRFAPIMSGQSGGSVSPNQLFRGAATNGWVGSRVDGQLTAEEGGYRTLPLTYSYLQSVPALKLNQNRYKIT